MEPKICSLTPVISIYYNLHLEFIYSTYLTDTDKCSDFKIKNGFILHTTTFHTSKINTKIEFKTAKTAFYQLHAFITSIHILISMKQIMSAWLFMPGILLQKSW